MTTTLILATSAQRPEYRRDFLTCLASPAGHRVAFSYKKAWFGDFPSGELVGRDAIIVFCDAASPRAEFEYIAVRHARIELLVPASIQDLRDATSITVVFTLRSLTSVTDADMPALRESWKASLTAVDHRPRPKDNADAAKARFVFDHPPLDESAGNPDERRSWRVLSEELGTCSTLSDAFFFRVGAMREAGATDGGLTSEARGSLHSIYPLAPSAEYELPMDAYSTSGKTPYSDAIDVTSSSELLTIQAVTQNSAGRASEAVLVLRAGEVKRAQIATIIIQGAKDFENLVPRVEIATRIKPNLRLAALLTLVIAAGVVLGGLPKDALGLSDVVLYPLKIAGGLIVGLATLYALGRVPGVGK